MDSPPNYVLIDQPVHTDPADVLKTVTQKHTSAIKNKHRNLREDLKNDYEKKLQNIEESEQFEMRVFCNLATVAIENLIQEKNRKVTSYAWLRSWFFND